MSEPLDLACPHCASPLRVPAELAGKKVKCKKCGEAFPVPVPVKPLPPEFAKPAAKVAKPAKPAAPAASADAPLGFAEDPDDDKNPYIVHKESDAPRCPHCAKELDPPDAKICLHCGYDLLDRSRRASRAVYQLTFGDYFKHHIGAILLLLFIIGLLVGSVICWINMADWIGDWVKTDERDPATGNSKYYVQPWCFSLWIVIIVLWVSWKMGKFVFRRFFIDYRPEEKVIKKSD